MGFLLLEDGTQFEATLFGAGEKVIGEVVFSTGMSGYQEVLTDPSFYGQIVVLTFPLVGNYGINALDRQSDAPKVRGFIVREACRQPSHWLAQETLQDYLRRHRITAAEGIDTRALTRKLREKGTMTGMLTPDLPTPEDFLALQEYKPQRPVPQVTTREVYTIPGEGYHLAVLDLGIKEGILAALQRRNCRLTVFPAHTRAADILSVRPDAIVLSNGPGNPKDNPEIVETVKILLQHKPVLGICLGHQLLALAAGADTEKLKYGHRGCNHPVKDLATGRVYITSQNHGYAVKEDSLDRTWLEITHRNLNDGTVEGLRFKDRPVWGIQFHPEACPGPVDTGFLFDRFLAAVAEATGRGGVCAQASGH